MAMNGSSCPDVPRSPVQQVACVLLSLLEQHELKICVLLLRVLARESESDLSSSLKTVLQQLQHTDGLPEESVNVKLIRNLIDNLDKSSTSCELGLEKILPRPLSPEVSETVPAPQIKKQESLFDADHLFRESIGVQNLGNSGPTIAKEAGGFDSVAFDSVVLPSEVQKADEPERTESAHTEVQEMDRKVSNKQTRIALPPPAFSPVRKVQSDSPSKHSGGGKNYEVSKSVSKGSQHKSATESRRKMPIRAVKSRSEEDSDSEDESQIKQEKQALSISNSVRPGEGSGSMVDKVPTELAKKSLFQKRVTMLLEQGKEDKLSTPTHRFIISPDAHSRLIWDLNTCILVLIEAVLVPVSVAFDVYIPDGYLWFSTTFFTLDMVANFFTGFYFEGELCMKQQMIARHYFSSWFIIDCLSTIPWQQLLATDSEEDSSGQGAKMLRLAKLGRMMRLIRLLRLAKLMKLVNHFEAIFSSYMAVFMLGLTKLVCGLFYMCHLSGCFWGFLGNEDKMFDTGIKEPYEVAGCEPGGPCEPGVMGSPWIRRYAIDTLNKAEMYTIALQWATGLATNGVVDIFPGATHERAFVILMMYFSFIVCSGIVAQIITVIGKINKDKAEFQEQVGAVTEFMVARKVPIWLQMKVKRFLEYQIKNSKHEKDDFRVLDNLSPWLRMELKEHLHQDILLRHPFFEGLPHGCLSHLCVDARVELHAPGDVVAQKGQAAATMFFIIAGKLKVLKMHGGKQVDEEAPNFVLAPPSYIDDDCLFNQTIRERTIVAVSHTELLAVDRESLNKVIEEFPGAQAYFENYKENLENGEFSIQTSAAPLRKSRSMSPNDVKRRMSTAAVNVGQGAARRLSLWTGGAQNAAMNKVKSVKAKILN